MNKVRQCYADPLRVPYSDIIERWAMIALFISCVPVLGILGVMIWDMQWVIQ
jgi:hypothetical protein